MILATAILRTAKATNHFLKSAAFVYKQYKRIVFYSSSLDFGS